MDCTGYRELSELRDTFWIAVRKDGGAQKGEGFGERKKKGRWETLKGEGSGKEVRGIERGGFWRRGEG